MKKIICIAFSMVLLFSLCACKKTDSQFETQTSANWSVGNGEMIISGLVEEVNSKGITLCQMDGYEWHWNGGDKVTLAFDVPIYNEKGELLTDISSEELKGKNISVICGESVCETYPGQLTDVRAIRVLNND